jgi:hypothetical protein
MLFDIQLTGKLLQSCEASGVQRGGLGVWGCSNLPSTLGVFKMLTAKVGEELPRCVPLGGFLIRARTFGPGRLARQRYSYEERRRMFRTYHANCRIERTPYSRS